MAAVNHDAGNTVIGVVVFFAEWTVVLVKELACEFVDLFAIKVRRVLGLLEEKGGGILKLFH